MNKHLKALIYRPLAVFTVTFFIVSSLLFAADTSFRLMSAVVFICLFAAVICFRLTLGKDNARRPYFNCALFFIGGALLASIVSHSFFDIRLSKYDGLCEKDNVYFEGSIRDVVWDGGFSSICIVNISECEGLGDFSCVMTLQGGTAEGYLIKGTADFSHLEKTSPFDERRYYLSSNVILKAEGSIEGIEKDNGFSLVPWVQGLNNSLSKALYSLLGEREGAFCSALLLGNKSELDDTVSRDFSRLGISHILALSGMHLTIICSFASTLLKPLGKRASQLGSGLTVVFYMFLTGFSPSVTRSGIMLLLLILSSLLGRSADKYTTLGLSVLLICIFDSGGAADIGLQLSFSAVMALFLFANEKRELAPSPDLKKKRRVFTILSAPFKSFGQGALMTVVIVLFMLPLEALYFGRISLISPVTSPLFSLLCTVLLWLLPILVILSPASTMASALAYPIKGLTGLILDLSERLARLRDINLSLNYPFIGIACALLFVSVTVFCILKKKKRLVAGAITLCLLLSAGAYIALYETAQESRVEVSMLNHKASDGIFMLSSGKAMIIDMGNGYSGVFDKGSEALSRSTATEIEAVMLTHVHKPHAASLDSFFSENTVRRLILPSSEDYELSAVEQIAEKHRVALEYYELGDTVDFEAASVNTSEHLYLKRSVQPVIRLDITAFDCSFSYVGSAYLEASPEADLSCEHIFFGSHGPLYKEIAAPRLTDNCSVYAVESSSKYIKTEKECSEPCKIILEG